MNPARRPLIWIFAAGAISTVAPVHWSLAQTIAPQAESEQKHDFYLFDWLPKKVFKYDTERTLQVCNDYRRHDIPLKVLHDGKLTPLIDFLSDATTIATVDQFGVVTGVATGTANVVATFGGVTDTTAVTVP